jgi:tyrosyl-tRNA synthetase
LAEQVKSAPHLRGAQRALALEVTSLVHSPEAANGAIQASKALFGQAELTDLSQQDLLSALSELPSVKAAKGASIAQLLVDTGLEASVSAGRRAIKEGGVYLNNEKVATKQPFLSNFCQAMLRCFEGVKRPSQRSIFPKKKLA